LAKTLKLASLLLQYLYTHKRLDLPGIGTFLLNVPFIADPENQKHDKQAGLESISFENNSTIKQNPDLVQFIADQTGKIRALASANLDSHLALAQQFLNIGNPFLFEGIGILEKIKSGEYSFTPGAGMQEKTKEYVTRGKPDTSDSGESSSDYKKIFYSGHLKTKWQNPVVVILIITGLALAVWGGYTVYKMTTVKNKSGSANKEKKNETELVEDSTGHFQKDSTVEAGQNVRAGNYKFVIETAAKERGMNRFNKLKSFGLDIRMGTIDSVTFKLFFIIQAAVSDTAKVLDSLRVLYTPAGNKAYIEN